MKMTKTKFLFEVKECPFCGKDAKTTQARTTMTMMANCPDIKCPGHYALSNIEEWNKRVASKY